MVFLKGNTIVTWRKRHKKINVLVTDGESQDFGQFNISIKSTHQELYCWDVTIIWSVKVGAHVEPLKVNSNSSCITL